MSLTKPPYQSMQIILLTALMWLVVMGPFLHMHVGNTRVTGFHVDGLTSIDTAEITNQSYANGSDVNQSESPALTIPTSHTRKVSAASSLDSNPFAIALFTVCISLLCAASIQVIKARPTAPPNTRDLLRYSLARLIHAPPVHAR